MPEVKNTKEAVAKIIEIATRISNLGMEKAAEDLIKAANKITSESFTGRFPDQNVMSNLVSFLNGQQISFVISGSLAAHLHGFTRCTEDIEIIVGSMPRVDNEYHMSQYNLYSSISKSQSSIRINHKNNWNITFLAANDNLRRYALLTSRLQNLLMHQVHVVEADALIALRVRDMVANSELSDLYTSDVLGMWRNKPIDMSDSKRHLNPIEQSRLRRIIGF